MVQMDTVIPPHPLSLNLKRERFGKRSAQISADHGATTVLARNQIIAECVAAILQKISTDHAECDATPVISGNQIIAEFVATAIR